jgi:hypothetical protein
VPVPVPVIRAVAFAGVTDRPDLEAAVTAGYRWDAGGPGQARPGGVVLLSPAHPASASSAATATAAKTFARATRAIP